jgi:outer membrane biogenesis lipoprotein LolB
MQRHFLFALLLICAGCAVTPRQPAGVPANVDLARLETWQARGRLGVSGPETGGSGSFDSQQRGDQIGRAEFRGRV